MIIALIIAIPVTAIISVFGTLKAVQLGLKWKVQVEKKEEPTLKTPIVDNYKENQEKLKEEKLKEQLAKQQNEAFKEWIGVEE